MSRGWNFEVVEGDEKRIFKLRVERLLGFFDGESNEDSDENLVRGFFNKMKSSDEAVEVVNTEEVEADIMDQAVVDVLSSEPDNARSLLKAELEIGREAKILATDDAEAVSRHARDANSNKASRVERLVEQSEAKAQAIFAEKQEAESS
jgi:hypothetical protein